jgi:DNA-binding transcriptional ArsR family regulator
MLRSYGLCMTADHTPAGNNPTDIASAAALLADPSRARILLALVDGRALPASRLATEAGVSPSTTSTHLAKLTSAGLLSVESNGRYRYYRLAGPEVGHLIEALQRVAPDVPVRSLRADVEGRAMREARTCYDHLAGRIGVEMMAAMLRLGYLSGGDGNFDPESSDEDGPIGFGRDVDYALTDSGRRFLDDFGAVLETRRKEVRYCVDWSEQRHHLAGALGQGLLARLTELGWIVPSVRGRSVRVTDEGRTGLAETFGISFEPDGVPSPV